MATTIQDDLNRVLEGLNEARLREVLDFARYQSWLAAEEERRAWLRFAPGEWDDLDDPDAYKYTEADIKRSGAADAAPGRGRCQLLAILKETTVPAS